MNARPHIKVLGMLLLAAVGILAIGTSAAQAKWLLLREGVSVLQLNLAGKKLLSELLVPGLGLKIHCKEGSMTSTLTLSADHKVLSESNNLSTYGCIALGFPHCTVKSPGAAAGEIKASASGTAGMNGEEVYTLLSSSKFTQINIEGALCAFSEFEETMNGSIKLAVLNPLTDSPEHLMKLDDDGLFFGEEAATLEGELLEPGVHDPWVLVHMKEASNATWAIHLVNL